MSVSGPRSLAKAIVLPSGDQDGWRSPFRSFVSCRRFLPSTSTTYRSVMPPRFPLKTSRLPSGDQLGLHAASRGKSSRRTVFRRFTSRM
jgi:hypothetical protein